MSDYEYFSSERVRTTISVGADNEEGSTPERINLSSDPPLHRKSRSLLSAAFTPSSLRLWEPRIHQVVGQLIEDMGDEPIIDIVKSFTSALPTIVIAELLGVPSEDRFLFKEWVDHLFLPFPIDNIEDVQELKRAAAKNYYNYLYPLVVAKRIHLTDDIISDLIRAEVDGDRLTDDEIVRMTMFILGAGIETTSHLLAMITIRSMRRYRTIASFFRTRLKKCFAIASMLPRWIGR